MLSEKPFSKNDLYRYLTELAKEYRKRAGKNMPAEIILIGGASVVINYGFREMTYDIDAVIDAASSMKDAINAVGDKNGLPVGWLNTDFMKTSSYTPKIRLYSVPCFEYSQAVSFRTVKGEYLIAMKLMAGRQYKYDLSDIVGILHEQEKKDMPIILDMVKKASCDLYGSYEALPERSRVFIEKTIAQGKYEEMYSLTKQMEKDKPPFSARDF